MPVDTIIGRPSRASASRKAGLFRSPDPTFTAGTSSSASQAMRLSSWAVDMNSSPLASQARRSSLAWSSVMLRGRNRSRQSLARAA